MKKLQGFEAQVTLTKTTPSISPKLTTIAPDFMLVAGLLATAVEGPRYQKVRKYGQRYVGESPNPGQKLTLGIARSFPESTLPLIRARRTPPLHPLAL
jgi:hypothetical protein